MTRCGRRTRSGPHETIFVLLLLMGAAGCRTGQQQWGPFRGQVVDAETGRPVTGAHVRVSWRRASLNPVHTTQSFYDAQETFTDANGRFEIPRLGRFVTVLVGEPAIGVFAPRYLMQDPEVTPSGGRPYVDATVIKLRPLKTREEQCKYQIAPISKTPRFTEAVNRYVAELNCRWPEGR